LDQILPAEFKANLLFLYRVIPARSQETLTKHTAILSGEKNIKYFILLLNLIK